jgi:hypothetical protein
MFYMFQIGFGFMQAEEYGYIGSRKLARDITRPPECFNKVTPVASAEYCLDPLLPSLAFNKKLTSKLKSIVAVDQVSFSSALFIHPASSEGSSALADIFMKSEDSVVSVCSI